MLYAPRAFAPWLSLVMFDERMPSSTRRASRAAEILADHKRDLVGALARHSWGRRAQAHPATWALGCDSRRTAVGGSSLGRERVVADEGGGGCGGVGRWAAQVARRRASGLRRAPTLTRSFSSLPTLKKGRRFGLTRDRRSPVRGLRPS